MNLCKYYFAMTVLLLSTQSAVAADRLWDLLREGGKVLLMRHLPVGPADPLLRDSSCRNEANLSEEGKILGKSIAKMFLDQNIPVGEVLASPYCRTRDSANLVFGKVKISKILMLRPVLDESQAEENDQVLLKIITTYQGQDNLVLVTHRPNIEAVSFETLGKGAFAVLLPMGDNEFEELGVISP